MVEHTRFHRSESPGIFETPFMKMEILQQFKMVHGMWMKFSVYQRSKVETAKHPSQVTRTPFWCLPSSHSWVPSWSDNVYSRDVVPIYNPGSSAAFLINPLPPTDLIMIAYEVGLGFIYGRLDHAERYVREFTDLSLATSHSNVHKSAGVGYSLLGAALRGLLLLLRLNLYKTSISIRSYAKKWFPSLSMLFGPS